MTTYEYEEVNTNGWSSDIRDKLTDLSRRGFEIKGVLPAKVSCDHHVVLLQRPIVETANTGPK